MLQHNQDRCIQEWNLGGQRSAKP